MRNLLLGFAVMAVWLAAGAAAEAGHPRYYGGYGGGYYRSRGPIIHDFMPRPAPIYGTTGLYPARISSGFGGGYGGYYGATYGVPGLGGYGYGGYGYGGGYYGGGRQVIININGY